MKHSVPERRRRALGRSCSIAGLALLLAACGGGAAAPQGPPPSQVSVVTLKAEPVTLSRELPGRTSAYLVAEVRPQVSGIVKRRLFTEGTLVEAGQPLYQIDDATYRADYDTARATLAKAEATLTVAQLTARRFAELAKINAVSAQDNEAAIAALRQAEAEVAAAKAAVRSTGVTLGYARITAPIGGRIGKSSVTQGALVTANQSAALATVQQLDPIYVDLTQSSRELLELRRQVQAGTLQGAGQMPVKIVLEDGSRYAHDGKLEFADVTVDQTTGSFALRVTVPNPDNTLLPGMYVRAVVDTAVRPQGVLVPQQGITRDPKGQATALVVGENDTVEQRTVLASRTVGDQWLVDGGLEPGDRVIVEGLQKVRPGVRVQAVEASAGAAGPAAAAPAAPST